MDDGQIIEDAPPDEFFDNPRQARTKRFLEAVF
jgi:ABC-type polar amino acid transport system ATPase subunit